MSQRVQRELLDVDGDEASAGRWAKAPSVAALDAAARGRCEAACSLGRALLPQELRAEAEALEAATEAACGNWLRTSRAVLGRVGRERQALVTGAPAGFPRERACRWGEGARL